MNEPDYMLGLHAQIACLWEATARKPGNVHRFSDFADTTYLDFATSAAAIAPVIATAPYHPVGATVAESVRLTRHVAASNTNLGIILLLAPLAKTSPRGGYRGNVEEVLSELTEEDAALTYYAIRMAKPGGLGEVEDQDVRNPPTMPLREAMQLAKDRDLIARQYANGFAEVFDEGAPAVLTGFERTGSVEGAIVYSYLHLMSRFPDSLLGRKRGIEEARESAEQAKRVLDLGWPESDSGWKAIRDLDVWLRAEGHSRNPGTTADLIAASLFVLLRQMKLSPTTRPWAMKEDVS